VSPYCRPCTRRYANTYYADKQHDCIVAKVYRLSRGRYAEMLESQGGRCAVCGDAESARFNGRVKRLAVDHDHVTGRVRALLCQRCNTVIGAAHEDTGLLAKAIAYLERHA
jgi:hypothetical protein